MLRSWSWGKKSVLCPVAALERKEEQVKSLQPVHQEACCPLDGQVMEGVGKGEGGDKEIEQLGIRCDLFFF